MSDWQEVKLRECISTLKGFAFKSKWYQPDGIPIVRVSDFTDNSISVDDIEYIPHDLAQEHSRYLLKTKDVIVQTVGSWQHNPVSIVGKVVNVPSNLNGALLNQNAVKIIPNKTIDNNFLYYRLKDEHFKLHNLGCAQGAANQASITLSSIGSFRFNLPPFPTQQKIAKILSNYDNLIENNLKRIKLLEESARLIYEEWFLRFRIDGKKLEIDPESSLPFGWELVELGDFLKFKKGKKADEIFEEKKDNLIKLLLLSGLGSGEYAYVEKARHVIARRGDVLMTMDGARSSVVFYSEDGAVGSTMSLVETGKLPKSYLYHFFKSTYEWLEINNTGAAIPHANKSFINKMKIIHPGDEILTKWSKKMYHINDQVFNLKDQNQLLKEARDILLPRLMTGMIDTDELDIAV